MFLAYRALPKYILSIIPLFVLATLLQGCTSLCPVEPANNDNSKELQKNYGDVKVGKTPGWEAARSSIKPSKEAEKFFDAVKHATKVIIIDGSEAEFDDREQTPLSCFDSDEEMFWKLLAALVSETTAGEPCNCDNHYIIRWYNRYKKLGEAAVHKDSGLTQLKYPGMPAVNLSPGEKPAGYFFIPKQRLKVISDAATALAKKRQKEVEKVRKGTSGGSEI